MAKKVVGYFEGTDPLLLTKLVVNGIDTFPVSNGYDNHGKQVAYLTKKDGVDVVVGYFHKAVPTEGMEMTIRDIFFACGHYNIPALLIVPDDLHSSAAKSTGGLPDGIKLVSPANIFDEVMKIIG